MIFLEIDEVSVCLKRALNKVCQKYVMTESGTNRRLNAEHQGGEHM